MIRKRATITVDINLDGVPGLFFQASDFKDLIQQYLEQTVPHYMPDVRVTNDGVMTDATLVGQAIANTQASQGHNVIHAIKEYRRLCDERFGHMPGLREAFDAVTLALRK